MAHVPPRRGNRKGTFAAWSEQVEQSKRMKKSRGKDEQPGDDMEWSTLTKDVMAKMVADMAKQVVVYGNSIGYYSPGMFPAKMFAREALSLPPLPRRTTTEPFAGFRSWRLCRDERGVALLSTAHDFVWDGPVLRDKEPPSERERGDQHTGIHGYKTARQAMSHGASHGGRYVTIHFTWGCDHDVSRPKVEHLTGDVWGEVMLFGTVVVHADGYRAQNAMIRSLYVPPETFMDNDGIVDALAARYGCDVHTDIIRWRAAWQ